MISLVFLAVISIANCFPALAKGWTEEQIKSYLSRSNHAQAVQGGSILPHNQTGTAAAKSATIWQKIWADNNVGGAWPTAFELLGLFTENDSVTTDWHSDYFPPNRMKLIHSVGAVAMVSFRPTAVSHPYTGLFKSGAKYGLIRAASATEPSTSWFTGTPSMTPGYSFKFFRDNVESANFLALWSLSATNSFNFYKHSGFCNHVGAANLSTTEQLLLDKFKTVSQQPGLIALSDFAMADEQGNLWTQPVFPFGLVLQTNPVYQTYFAGSTSPSVGDMFSQFNFTDPHVCKVYAVESPAWPPTLTHIADIYLESVWRASQFADDGLFFRHVFIEQDWSFEPAWAKAFNDPAKKRWEIENFELYAPYLPPF